MKKTAHHFSHHYYPQPISALFLLPSKAHAGLVDKPLFVPVPDVTINIPGSLLIGKDLTYTIEFDNTSPTDFGFVPCIDIFLPRSGANDSTAGEKEDGIIYTDVDYY